MINSLRVRLGVPGQWAGTQVKMASEKQIKQQLSQGCTDSCGYGSGKGMWPLP